MFKGLGSGDNGEFTFLDILAVVSFLIGFQNLNLNLTQEDKQQLENDLTMKADMLLKEIHEHLRQQDNKIDQILEMVKDKKI